MSGRKSITTPKKNAFGAKLKVLRLARGLTQTEMVARLGTATPSWELSEGTYGHIENGRRMISDLELLAILKILKAKLHDLES